MSLSLLATVILTLAFGSWFLPNVKALLIWFSEWAHFLLNLARLLRYDATKSAPTRAFMQICMEKSQKIGINF